MVSIPEPTSQFERHLALQADGIGPFVEEHIDSKERAIEQFLETIVGHRAGLRHILTQVKSVAPTTTTVLLTGETGTGKELIAQAIHELSPRHSRKIVKINCAAIPAGLLENELFGHERGAFTGAVNSYAGRFSIADRGTLFLDEIGDISLETQPKLLRVLEEREFEAVGSTRTSKVDVRVIAATNLDLKKMVAKGSFREDLFYRLHVFPICVPPLRERKEDIPLLVRHFISQLSSQMNKDVRKVSDRAMRSMIAHSWPGNVRELLNFVTRGVILAAHGTFDLHPPENLPGPETFSDAGTLDETIRRQILAACWKANWRIGGRRGAAAMLGLKRTTLFYKMKRFGIQTPEDSSARGI
jgi:formate hydrogenlyase transcriptional activator